MTRDIQKVGVYKVDSQPGDGTRYHFIIRQDGDFMWIYGDEDSSIRYPKYLRRSQIENIDTADMNPELLTYAERSECNPWTLAECIRAINIMTGGYAAEITR